MVLAQIPCYALPERTPTGKIISIGQHVEHFSPTGAGSDGAITGEDEFRELQSRYFESKLELQHTESDRQLGDSDIKVDFTASTQGCGGDGVVRMDVIIESIPHEAQTVTHHIQPPPLDLVFVIDATGSMEP